LPPELLHLANLAVFGFAFSGSRGQETVALARVLALAGVFCGLAICRALAAIDAETLDFGGAGSGIRSKGGAGQGHGSGSDGDQGTSLNSLFHYVLQFKNLSHEISSAVRWSSSSRILLHRLMHLSRQFRITYSIGQNFLGTGKIRRIVTGLAELPALCKMEAKIPPPVVSSLRTGYTWVINRPSGRKMP
jgi:hypothetical protein